MPLKKQSEIHKYFDTYDNIEFVHFEKEKIDSDTYKRVQKYHFFPGKNQPFIKKIINKLLLILQFGINRNSNIRFQKGANWFSITGNLAQYIVDNKKYIEKIFKYTLCGDEMFLQTLVINSKYAEKVSENNFCDNYETIKYYIDWERGAPYEFTADDFELLTKSNMFFARKFNWNKDSEVIKKICNEVKESREEE